MLLQRHGIVVLGIFRGKEQCDVPLSGFLRELLHSLTLIIQFCGVSLLEFIPPDRVMPEPFPQAGARREFLEPFINSRFFFLQPARQDAVHEHASAIGLSRLVINAFRPNAHAPLLQHKLHLVVREYASCAAGETRSPLRVGKKCGFANIALGEVDPP